MTLVNTIDYICSRYMHAYRLYLPININPTKLNLHINRCHVFSTERYSDVWIDCGNGSITIPLIVWNNL